MHSPERRDASSFAKRMLASFDCVVVSMGGEREGDRDETCLTIALPEVAVFPVDKFDGFVVDGVADEAVTYVGYYTLPEEACTMRTEELGSCGS